MDITTALETEALKMGIGGLLLLAAVFYLVKRDDRLQQEDRKRTDQSNADLRATITANREECSKREADMVKRIRDLENDRHKERDDRHKETSALLSRSVGALETITRIAEHMAKDDTGLQKAIKGDHS